MLPLFSAWLIVGTCSALVLIAQTWRVARSNPVEKLKQE